MIKGLPASGKTTEALKLVRESKGRFKRFNLDEMRRMLHAGGVDLTYDKKILSLIHRHAIEASLMRGYDIVDDNTNLHRKYFNRMARIAERIGDVEIIEKYIECPLDECLRRNKSREHSVPDELIRNMHQNYIKHKPVTSNRAYFPAEPKVFEPLPGLPDAILVDIDGTIALSKGVRNYYDLTNVADDHPNLPVVDIVKTYADKGVLILLVSGRSESARDNTQFWAQYHQISYNCLYMRGNDDNRRDCVVKQEIYENEIKGKYNILFILDDRPQVAKMWREEYGHTVLQPDDLDF